MATTNYNDLRTVHRYLDEITTFIQAIIENENDAILLACAVLEEHKKIEDTHPFESEEERGKYLRLRSRNAAIHYLRQRKFEYEKAKSATT